MYLNWFITTGESALYFRQYILGNFDNWRKCSGVSPIYLWIFASGESPIGESLIGEVPVTRLILYLFCLLYLILSYFIFLDLFDSVFGCISCVTFPFSFSFLFYVHSLIFILCTVRTSWSSVNANKKKKKNNDFLFPRHYKLSELIDSTQISSLSSPALSLSLEAIENTILRAYFNVCRLVVDMNIYQQDQLLPLKKMSKLANLQLMKSRIVDYSSPDIYDPEFYSDSDDSNSEDDEAITENDADVKTHSTTPMRTTTYVEISSTSVLQRSTVCEFSMRLIRHQLSRILVSTSMVLKSFYINKRLLGLFQRTSLICLLIV